MPYLNNTSLISRIYIFVSILLIILSPYLNILGQFIHGGLLGSAMLFLLTVPYLNIAIKNRHFLFILVFFYSVICLYLLSVLMAQNIDDELLVFPGLIVKVALYIFLGILLGSYLDRSGYDATGTLKIYMYFVIVVGLLNSVVVIATFFNPDLKLLVESFLYQDLSDIDYLEGFKPRGIASAGGASLSVFHAITALILIWFLIHWKMRKTIFLIYMATLVLSIILIGRTGIIIFCLGIFFIVAYLLLSLKSSFIFNALFMAFISTLFGSMAAFFLPDILGNWIYNYMIGFLYDGMSGLATEGTTDRVLSFYEFPDDILSFLIGHGDFNGSFDHETRADAGYMKTFTAVGFIGSVLVYGGVIHWTWTFFRRASKAFDIHVLLIFIVSLLLFSEFKEPFILQGYSSRFLWLMLGLTLSLRLRVLRVAPAKNEGCISCSNSN